MIHELLSSSPDHLPRHRVSDSYNYERAAVFRDRIQSLRQVRLQQSVSDFSEKDADIIAAFYEYGKVCINVVMIRGGRHLGDKSFFPPAVASKSASGGVLARSSRAGGRQGAPGSLRGRFWEPFCLQERRCFDDFSGSRGIVFF